MLRRRPKYKNLNSQQINTSQNINHHTKRSWNSPRSPDQFSSTSWYIAGFDVCEIAFGEGSDGVGGAPPEEEGAGYEVGGVEAG